MLDPDRKRKLERDILEAVIRRAADGSVEAIMWLERHGLIFTDEPVPPMTQRQHRLIRSLLSEQDIAVDDATFNGVPIADLDIDQATEAIDGLMKRKKGRTP